MSLKPLIIIPARMDSKRLPGKMMAMIQGKPMIQHVYERALSSNLGPVIVATPDAEIKETIEKLSGHVILTNPHHKTGTDRIFEAYSLFNERQHYDIILNVQGDLPTLDKTTLERILNPFENSEVDIATLAVPIRRKEDLHNPHIVKIALEPYGRNSARAIYFSRTLIPGLKDEKSQEIPYYHHIGIYAYKRSALERFISLPESLLERTEGLEQLRALANGMRLDVTFLEELPLAVDTPEDLLRVRRYFERAH